MFYKAERFALACELPYVSQHTDPLVELSQIERAAMRAIAARKQREQCGTAFQPDADEAVSDASRSQR